MAEIIQFSLFDANAGGVQARLLRRSRFTSQGCWEWSGAVHWNGYGKMGIGKRADGTSMTGLVHRVAYEAWKGRIEEGLHVHHTCGNRLCFNPEHLVALTREENMNQPFLHPRNPKPRGIHPKRLSLEERFWSKVDRKDESGCWLWKGRVITPNGQGGFPYGQFDWRDPNTGKAKSGLAHRVCWWLTHGNLPVDLCVCHHCDEPGCVNPSHLFLGTILDNMQDRHRKGRYARNIIVRDEHGRIARKARVPSP